MEINNNLINDFKKVNSQLKTIHKPLKDIGAKKIRHELDIKIMKKLTNEELISIRNKGDIVGVDGSKNKKGNLHPHYLVAISALAKSMDLNKEPVLLYEVFSPLIDKLSSEKSKEKEDNIMAELEVQVAIKSIEEYNPYIIMMDGSLMTYSIKCYEKWKELKRKCIENNILLIGVIEEIKTKEIVQVLKAKHIDIGEDVYDKEVLFGLLNEGEYINILPEKSKKIKENIDCCFLRTSSDPSAIAMDFLSVQKQNMQQFCDIVYTLTPKNSRGIPIWLDIVDKEVKITDEMMNALIDTYIDKDLSNLFIKPKREERSL
ncbi:DNA double-strand break repair nuclease NurA [Tepidibacter hydrothermalis]|uniref:DNA double-strand break repair nuclease NurA n=1 Tax=Tepidibacter hydrothermalis TaxID=3036126 RepID=A0ABY8EC13_9FIRM|nr:DNA double-strand break repair nuclease NurA [Tepidibacter hydrothermalis]WFD10434.1 DNA double-strand break repair nuclease NurA [Tepidibacter hydrothermalis]